MSQISSLQTSQQSPLVEMVNDQFSQLSITDDVSLTDFIWRLNTPTQIVSLDFSVFSKPHMRFTQAVTVNYGQTTLVLDLFDVAKLLWLDAVKGKSERRQLLYGVFDFIALVFAYITTQEEKVINQTNLCDFYGFCLTRNITPSGTVKRISAPAYKARFEPLTLLSLKKTLRRFGIEGIIGQITQKTDSNALNDACLSLMNITRSEYTEGGSFNFLGLDIGKHYIDHCYNLFERHAPFITSIRQTIAWWEKEAITHLDLQISSRRQQTRVLGRILCGHVPNKAMVTRCDSLALDKCRIAESLIHDQFRKNYNLALRKVSAFKISTINKIVEVLELPERYDTQEFVRSLLFVDLFGEHGKSKKSIVEEYRSVMARADKKLPLSMCEIESRVKTILDENCSPLPDSTTDMRQFFQDEIACLPLSLKTHRSGGIVYFNKVCSLIEDAGVTCFVGLTGWRASEYGFPLSSIDITTNPDPLDNYFTPFRFHVRWKLPKTSGETLLDREITLGSYLIATQLADMNNSGTNKPALYQATNESHTKSSEKPISLAIPSSWIHFVKHYCLFADMDRWEALKDKDSFSNADTIELKRLKKQYNFDSSQIQALINMKNELRQDLPRVSICLEDHPDKTFGKLLALYAEGKATSDITILFDRALSENTRDEIKTGEAVLDKAAVRFIRGEFLAGAAYPTPHALRHIWAEAVLRRYRGDVGRFIRANFKHIDERFFMAYLRNKEMKAIHQVASRQVINSVVRQQINNLQDDDRAYAGGFDRFLSKAVSITKVYTHEERMQLADKISQDRITAIKSNPWGTCLLRQGTDELAKCSVDGEPQRQNASPSLCLGCLNANISEGNFNGIVVYTKQDVLACRNPDLPWFIKEPHVRTVNLALKRVKELRGDKANPKYDKFIQHLEASLELAEQNKGNAA